MDAEIKTLLHLASIPGFKLMKKQEAKLEAWKKEQKKIVPKKAKKTRAPKGFTTMSGMGDENRESVVPTESIKKRTNVVKKNEKEIGEIAEES